MRFRECLDKVDQCAPLEMKNVMTPECRYEKSDLWREYLDGLKTEVKYEALKKAVVDNVEHGR